jgi:hypothetical protein
MDRLFASKKDLLELKEKIPEMIRDEIQTEKDGFRRDLEGKFEEMKEEIYQELRDTVVENLPIYMSDYFKRSLRTSVSIAPPEGKKTIQVGDDFDLIMRIENHGSKLFEFQFTDLTSRIEYDPAFVLPLKVQKKGEIRIDWEGSLPCGSFMEKKMRLTAVGAELPAGTDLDPQEHIGSIEMDVSYVSNWKSTLSVKFPFEMNISPDYGEK